MRVGAFHLYEIFLALAGILILLSVPLIALHGIFTWWFIAKAVYLIGVVCMLAEFCIKKR
jgi:hypothetical protein